MIHYRSLSGRKNVFGRTDRGKKGVHDFFQTHHCSELCRMLNRKWVSKLGESQLESLDAAGLLNFNVGCAIDKSREATRLRKFKHNRK